MNLEDYLYHLPENRIALHPAKPRDSARLLVWQKGEIIHSHFRDLTKYLPANSTLVFNDTKVIPARLLFKNETGARIEVFLLEPILPSPLHSLSLEAKGSCLWSCAIGNLKRWKKDHILKKTSGSLELSARLIDRERGTVEFSWKPAEMSFSEVLEIIGETPLPPYLHRETELEDKEVYQTIYSENEGAVAAPTAGLHFTTELIDNLCVSGIKSAFVTLHVSAGTFMPVKVSNPADHKMHSEWISIPVNTIEHLIDNQMVIAVGTTSARTLESLYWYGMMLTEDKNAVFSVSQDIPYSKEYHPITKKEALKIVLERAKRLNLANLEGKTSLFIYPGYSFKICDGLITNFHQPGSTLLMLVDTFLGGKWKLVYEEAMENGYRFLSFGDSSLLFRPL